MQAGQTPSLPAPPAFLGSQVYRDLSRQEEGVPAHITRPRRLPPMPPLTPLPFPLPLPQPPPRFPLLFPSFPTSPFPLPCLTDPPRHSMESRERGYQGSAAHFRQKPQGFREAQGRGKVGRVRALEQLLHLYPPDILVSFQQGIFSASAWKILSQVAQNLLQNPDQGMLLPLGPRLL